MATQKKLAPYKPVMIPTPRTITAACGMSLRLSLRGKEELLLALEKTAVESGTYTLYCWKEGEYQAFVL